ncbi:MAG: hypothetical protein EA352_00205, partial [Gemmatimonadales bacterium]
MDTLPDALSRTLLFAVVLVLAGSVAWRAFLCPRLKVGGQAEISGDTWARMERRSGLVALLAAVLLLPALLLRLWTQVREFRDPFVPFSEDLAFILRDTFWGTAWTGQLALALLLPPLFLLVVRGAGSSPPGSGRRPADLAEGESPLAEWPGPWLATGAGVALLALGLSLQSHAMSMSPAARPLGLTLDWAHQMAAGAWVGTIVMVLAASPAPTDPGGPPRSRLLALQFQAFRPLAMVAVALMVFAGTILASGHMAGPADLWTTEWGRTLSAKVAVALAAVGVGAWNAQRGVPGLVRTGRSAPLSRAVALELGLALLVLVLTALQVTPPQPPRGH